MNLTLRRIATNSNETLGILSVNGEVFCHTLEDEHRTIKVANETCIPSGTYEIKLRPPNEGNVNKKYSEKFGAMHRGMLWLQDVENFTWIYIHMGNTEKHTSGCILVGQQSYIDDQGRLTIQRSEAAYRHLYKSVVDAAENSELTIHILDDEN